MRLHCAGGYEKSILFISNLFSAGLAYGGVCKELADHLSKVGWKVTTSSAVTNRWLRPVDMMATLWRRRNDYAVAQIDVFSGAAFRWAESTAWGMSQIDKPFVLTLHGGDLPSFGVQYPERVRKLLAASACVTTPSRYLMEQMQSFHDDVCLIPNPINLQSYPFRLRASPSPQLLYLRAIHKMYNPLLAVSVIQTLQHSYGDLNLLIIGPDKGDGTLLELQQAVNKAQLNDVVRIAGPVRKSEVPSAISRSDILINTTNVDNTPISVIEAMACGLCIVSTNVGGIPYLLTHEHDALLVPPNDPQAMADAVRRILTEPGLAERLSRNARKTAEQFDWSIILPQWEALLIDVIERHSLG